MPSGQEKRKKGKALDIRNRTQNSMESTSANRSENFNMCLIMTRWQTE